jgi:hypothetical protein
VSRGVESLILPQSHVLLFTTSYISFPSPSSLLSLSPPLSLLLFLLLLILPLLLSLKFLLGSFHYDTFIHVYDVL